MAVRGLRFWRRRWRRVDEDAELDREIAVHLLLEREEQLDRGLAIDEARLAAHKAFGSVALTKDQIGDMRRGAMFDLIRRELRQAARRLARAPVFSLATVLTLGLAIGATTAIFTVVDRVLLNPLPYGDSGRLVTVEFGLPARNVPSGMNITLQLYYQFADRARTLNGIAVHRPDERTLTGDDIPERIRVSRTTPSLARVLRVSPMRGRWFTDREGEPGGEPAAVLSYGFWRRRYGDAEVVGRRLTLDGVATTIVGIMPPAFAFPDPRVEVWIADPMSRAIAASPAVAGVYDYVGVARLRDGIDLADARAELTQLAVALAAEHPGQGYHQLASTATPLIEATVGRIAPTLWLLLAAVGLVFLVACANVANLFLVRSEAKQREVAVRRALGAGAAGIAGYFLAESAWLVAAGGAAGLGLAWGAVRLVMAFGPSTLPRLHELRLDGTAIAFTAALSVIAAAVFGAVPILRLGSVTASLRDGARTETAARSRHFLRQILMAAQVAVALVLLVSSGLMLRSFQNLRAVDPGFDSSSALTFRVGLPAADYPDRDKTIAAHRAILARLARVPGVASLSASTCLPLADQGCFGGPLFIEGRPLPEGVNPPLVRFGAVADGYFETMGMRLRGGRAIDRTDLDRNQPVVIINQALASLAFPKQDPIGQRVRIGNPLLAENPAWFKIAGVVADTSYRALAEASRPPMMYMPIISLRAAGKAIAPALGSMSYVLRTSVRPESIVDATRRAVLDVDNHLAIAQVRTLRQTVDRASAQMAFAMVLLVVAAGVALTLGVIGIYGVMAYLVTQRTGEIGVRLALGARPRGIVAMIVRQGGASAAAGVFAGLAIAAGGSRVIDSLLFGVDSRDPAVFAAAPIIVLATALVACWLPARRAAHLNPVEALRAG